MEVEVVTRKHSRTYRCPDDLDNFLLRVRLRDVDADTEEVQIFRWQQKKHGPFARDFYKDERNCVTDDDKRYHEDVKNMLECEDLVFSYVEEDGVEMDEAVTTSSKNQESLPIATIDTEQNISKGCYDFEKSLQRALGNSRSVPQYEKMYIVADFGEYFEDTWLKCEHVLCTIKYDRTTKIMIMYPDYTQIQPYSLKINADSSRRYEYWLENASLDGVERDELLKETEILRKMTIYDRRRRGAISGDVFVQPPPLHLHVHVFLEVLTASGFEHKDIYVRYVVDLPPNWTAVDDTRLTGVTPSCRGNDVLHFGFPFDLTLEYNLQSIENESQSSLPCVYFEVISKGSWSRYRTEGLAYRRLPVGLPGHHQALLRCVRLQGARPSTDLRRFFVGDCGSCADPTWTGSAEEGPANRCGVEATGSGELRIGIRVVRQSAAGGAGPAPPGDGRSARERRLADKLHDVGLMTSVERVLDAFKKARSNMLEARRRI